MRNRTPFNLDDAIPRSLREQCRALEDAGIDFPFERDSSQSLRLSKETLSAVSQRMPPMPSVAAFSRDLQKKLIAADRAMRQNNVMQLALCYGFCAEIRRTGVKVFRPSVSQCMAMEQVSIDIPLSNYRQPYEVIIVEYPREYAEIRAMQYRFAVCYHRENYLSVWRRHSEVFDDTFVSSLPDRTLEDALNTLREGAIAQSPCKEAVRTAINCCMMLANFPIQLNTIGSASFHRANRERARRMGRRYLPPREITFVQNIAFHEERPAVSTERPDSFNDVRHRPKPHWRRGHWRKQPFGPGRAGTKIVFIKPILINARFSLADPALRQVIYEG